MRRAARVAVALVHRVAVGLEFPSRLQNAKNQPMGVNSLISTFPWMQLGSNSVLFGSFATTGTIATTVLVGAAAIVAVRQRRSIHAASTSPLVSRLKPLEFKHALMSHRGGSMECIENTLTGFRRSVYKLQVDLLEARL